ncbi:hypothetical protein IJ380_03665 [Candidatus Saccharibacteria bacterium]|nr:hypothetical protein [Candidatus Saccharibacteria bacterium]
MELRTLEERLARLQGQYREIEENFGGMSKAEFVSSRHLFERAEQDSDRLSGLIVQDATEFQHELILSLNADSSRSMFDAIDRLTQIVIGVVKADRSHNDWLINRLVSF